MHLRSSFALLLLLSAMPASAKDIYLSIGGSVGVFRTDARIINPSYDKDITITARYLPVGNVNNAAVATKTITVNRRSMAVYDDVVQSLFGGGPALGAVRLTSEDDFIATQRIYALSTCNSGPCTLGQFVPGLDVTTAQMKGALSALKSSPAFRTNIGVVNPNDSEARVTWKLFDKSNNLVSTGATITMPPFAVIGPTNMAGNFFFTPGTADMSDAWVSFVSDKPIFAYGSVVDNASTDPTFVPAVADSGVEPVTPPPPPAKTVTVTAFDFGFAVTTSETLRAGDEVKFIVSRDEGLHGFALQDPTGRSLLNISLPTTPAEHLVTLTVSGKYSFACNNSACGTGHFDMFGDITVLP